jgi:hypothetical protein
LLGFDSNWSFGPHVFLSRTKIPSSSGTIFIEVDACQDRWLKVVPGMPVEAFIQTGSQTALSDFLKPLADQVMQMFRDS